MKCDWKSKQLFFSLQQSKQYRQFSTAYAAKPPPIGVASLGYKLTPSQSQCTETLSVLRAHLQNLSYCCAEWSDRLHTQEYSIAACLEKISWMRIDIYIVQTLR